MAKTIVEAAELVSQVSRSYPDRYIPFSNIPLFIHQKWNGAQLNDTREDIVSYIEQWLERSIAPTVGSNPMGYFLWDDDGVLALVEKYEKDFADDFVQVFSPVEKVDIFRIIVCKWFGGVVGAIVLWVLLSGNNHLQYGNIDTKPLRHPATWIEESDISKWTDNLTGKQYGLDRIEIGRLEQKPGDLQPVNAIWGIECDTDPNTDRHWRFGYTFALQLTNWALASAPQHPILQRFLDTLMDKARDAKEAALLTPNGSSSQLHYDPLARTGPVAVTEATRGWLEERQGLRWNALTGLKDDGKTKLAGDVLILPMTGFR
ncbi:hypothetical protein QQS21_007107 [Conoideocrella luteorostrata]|uniref:Uncharacterized protein n=1 Tax=Conoideocrella luteorostrata TaxID=1105319 RepID=A0AAJ0CP80_9HYPO|nr:hypothetical protein QQS21_007107 [Conoideocrella luteorostrata]